MASQQARGATAPDSPPGESPRLGPRPLPLHLMAAGLTWASCKSGLPLWSSGSLPWKGNLAERAESLRNDLAQSRRGTDLAAFAAAVDAEVARRLTDLAAGIEAYRRHPYRRDLAEPPVIWRQGACRLLDYGAIPDAAPEGPTVLVVPSLINRAYVLDLTCSYSLAEIQKYAQVPPGQALLLPPPDSEAPDDLFPQTRPDCSEHPKEPSDNTLLDLWTKAKSKIYHTDIQDYQITNWFEKKFQITVTLNDFDAVTPPAKITEEMLATFCESVDRYTK